MSHLHHSTKKTVDLKQWGEPFNLEDVEDSQKYNAQIIIGYTLYQLEVLQELEATDYRLHKETREIFEGWNRDIL